jgi:hypothetical protein
MLLTARLHVTCVCRFVHCGYIRTPGLHNLVVVSFWRFAKKDSVKCPLVTLDSIKCPQAHNHLHFPASKCQKCQCGIRNRFLIPVTWHEWISCSSSFSVKCPRFAGSFLSGATHCKFAARFALIHEPQNVRFANLQTSFLSACESVQTVAHGTLMYHVGIRKVPQLKTTPTYM